MKAPKPLLRSSPSPEWTIERVCQLARKDIEQLRDNAAERGAAAIVALCDEALNLVPKAGRGRAAKGATKLRTAGR